MVEWKDRIGAMFLSLVVVVGFIAVCGAMFYAPPIATEMKELSMLLLGVLAAGFTTTINFWMGSSSASQKKDATIAAQITNNTGNGTHA